MASKKLERPLRIAEAAKLLGVSQPTLRRWEAIGKFVPRRHPMNGYRLYDRDRVIKLRDEIMTGAGGVMGDSRPAMATSGPLTSE